MKKGKLFELLAAALMLCAAASAQETPAGHGRFQKDGLSFDYPAGWTLTDKSTADAQDLSVTRPGGSASVRVIAHREPLQKPEQIIKMRAAVTDPFVKALARSLGVNKTHDWDESRCLALGERFATGFLMTGRLGGQPTTAEVYTVVTGQRLVHLIYVRADMEEATAAPAWRSVLDTLKVEPPANPSPEAEQFDRLTMGGLTPGKALKKPAPRYPDGARHARVTGAVTVKIEVDEKGNVVSARAVAGHHLLHGAAEEAAMQAKYSPTLVCGRPVKVSGLITYNFAYGF